MNTAEQFFSTSKLAAPPSLPGLGHGGSPMDLPVRFRFVCFDASFLVAAEDRDGKAILDVRAAIRHLPYSAENPAMRRRLRAVLRAAAEALPNRLVLTSRQQIEFRGDVTLDAPPYPAEILRQTTILLLRWRPLFDIVRGQA